MTTSVSSSSSGTISSLGLGSGLDSNGIVSKLVELERSPITQLQTRATKLQTQVSAYGQIQSSVTSFRDAARKIADPSFWGTMTSTSTDAAAVNFSTSTGAAAGNYSVDVIALAKAQNVVLDKATSAATDTIGAGTLTFEKGSWVDGVFEGSGTAVDVSISATDTLEDIRDKINSAGAGINASIIVDSSGARLAFTSSATGAANGFRVQVQDASDASNTDALGLSMLAYDPENATAGTMLAQPAQDASVTVNGVPLTSTTNSFATALTNISFTVGKLTVKDSPVNVTVSQDKDTIAKAITEFATAYTSLSDLLHADTKYDDTSKSAGVLQGDATAVSILNQFRTALGSGSTASSVFGTLSAVGLSIGSTGGLTVDSTKLNSALGNLAEVKKLFTAAGTGNGDDGIATRLRTLGSNMLSFDGTLASRTKGLNTLLSNNQKRQDELDARATLYENRLRAQYSALDTSMAGITSQSQYVTQMITAWNKAS